MNIKTAILIDGSFFLKRYKYYKQKGDKDFYYSKDKAKNIVNDLYAIALSSMHRSCKKEDSSYLYRIFYYDCFPYKNKEHNPKTNKSIDFSKENEYLFRMEFYNNLRKNRKVALRLGELKKQYNWTIKPSKLDFIIKKLREDKENFLLNYDSFNEEDFILDFKQVGIDMKIAVDISSLSYKKLVDKIILISGDSDFVPASKIARREGIDFILNPMGNHIDISLEENIDGLINENTILRIIDKSNK